MTGPDLVPRAGAAAAIAAAIADRTSYVISIEPVMLAEVANALHDLPAATIYCDSGLPACLRATTAGHGGLFTVALMVALTPRGSSAGVALVPKTVPPAELNDALDGIDGHGKPTTHVPADGSQDLVLLHEDPDQMQWPLLLVEALKIADPAAAQWALAIEAADKGLLS